MNWQRLFADHILDRGYDYYCDDSVTDLTRKEDVVTATVYGTEEYNVEITFEHGKITDMYCSCPHAEEGNHCKHMAAVLFELEEGEDEEEDEDDETYQEKDSLKNEQDNRDDAAALVSEAGEEIVRKFLIAILRDDDKLKIRFKNLIQPGVSREDMKHYKKQIDNIVRKHQGRGGFIDYYGASHFISDLEEFLNEDVRMMLDDRDYEEAFELTNYIFVTAGNVDIDDSNGEIGMLADECYSIWKAILEKGNINVKRMMYNWFTSHLDGSIIDYMEEYIEQILMEDFNEQEFIDEKLIFTDKKVKEAEKTANSWSKEYQAGQWALRHLSLMEKNKKSWSELEAYCKECWKYSYVRKYYIDKCIGKKDYDRAIEVLKESQTLDNEYGGLVKEYSIKLKEIYQLLGKKKEYIEQLWKLNLKDDAGNLAVYKELKKQYSKEEWVIQRERVFNALPRYASAAVLYKEEKLYDRLLKYIQQSPGLYALREYHDVLKKDYPKEILEKYAAEVEKMAESTSDRKRYQELVAILRKMNKLEGGKQKVNEITSRWKVDYRNRRAMMDELSKL